MRELELDKILGKKITAISRGATGTSEIILNFEDGTNLAIKGHVRLYIGELSAIKVGVNFSFVFNATLLVK